MAIADEIVAALQSQVRSSANAAFQCLEANLKRRAPRDTGATRGSVSVVSTGFDSDGNFGGVASATTPQADYTDAPRGTGGGEYIYPLPSNPKGLLFFEVDGQLVAARRVRVSRKHEGWFSNNVESDLTSCLERTLG